MRYIVDIFKSKYGYGTPGLKYTQREILNDNVSDGLLTFDIPSVLVTYRQTTPKKNTKD